MIHCIRLSNKQQPQLWSPLPLASWASWGMPSPFQRPGSFAWQMEVVESALNQNSIRIVPAKKNPNLIHQDPVFGNPNPWPERLRSVQKVSQRPAHTLSLNYAAGSVRRIHIFLSLCIPLHPPKAYGNGGKTWKNSSYTDSKA